ncbi:aminopeptidase P family protein [Collimonas pratensis]|uniref:Metallopeptidase M24 family protein n=1 Tax=Collimonas pratensis TaxID=279113 RepID=A0A127Q548_9BURK|nr:aminopeptidase P family protein [Collimonas pratensis]AMP05198.1 metallopeptidase M24 family protein [Collimonas pratensis]
MNSRTFSQTTAAPRIQLLRDAMKRHNVDACLIPSADPHLSEYLPGRWKGREWLSGFTGSVANLIITADFAGLWADSRYWSQAEAELAGTEIVLMKTPTGSSLLHLEWLSSNLAPGQTLAVDAAVLGLATARALELALAKGGSKLRTDLDVLGDIWSERPGLPMAEIYQHDAVHAPLTRAAKLEQLRQAMQQQGAGWHFISTLDDIAYLFNLRGADVNFNPVFLAHALIGPQQTTLFVADGKVPAALRDLLLQDGVALAPYAQATEALATLPADAVLLLDPRRVTLGLRQAVGATVKVVEAINPTTFAKSRKSAAEVSHVRAAMEQDGAALCEFFSWLEQAIAKREQEAVTELMVDTHITAARARRPGFVSPSFATIAGFNANGAMPHYKATVESHATISGEGLLLIDSGGQYVGGTTDITRMVPVGQPSAAQKRDCTLVLKGVIALSSAQFPRSVKSPMLDAIARAPIWAAGIDYGHGTGHGVGYFLNVHEGPQVISNSAAPEAHTAMEAGMITSIEPGIYRPGCWGVRIENLVLNQEAESTEFGDYLRFETLTLCPIDTRCLDASLLRSDEIDWLNAYHAQVRERLTPHVRGDALQWLEERTQPL